MYQFKKLNDDRLSIGTSKIMNSNLARGIGSARFRGASLTFFGEPTMKSNDAECAFNYVIEAQDDKGSTWLLTIYEGPSRPAIGGGRSEGINEAAKALLSEIENTKPADFNEDLVYYDFDTKIHYGCKDGVCFYNEI